MTGRRVAAKPSASRTAARRALAAAGFSAMLVASFAAAPVQSQARCSPCHLHGGEGTGVTAVAMRATAQPPLNLTVVIDKTTDPIFAQQNQSILDGATVGVDDLDALPGRVHIKLVTRELDGLSEKALAAQLRAAVATALVLPCDTDSEYQLAAEASKLHTLMFSPCDSDPSAGGRYPTYWGVGMGANTQAAGVAQFIASVGPRYVFIVSGEGARSMSLLAGYFREAAPAYQRKVVGSATIPLRDPNYAALARRILSGKVKPVIFTTLPPPYANRLVAGLAAHGVTQAVFGNATMDTPLTVSSTPAPTVTQIVYMASYGFLREDAPAEQFSSAFTKRFDTPIVGAFPGLGLETVRLLATAAETARSASPTAIDAALEGGLTLTGVGLADRTYTRDGDHNPITEVAIAKVNPGSIVPVVASVPSAIPLP